MLEELHSFMKAKKGASGAEPLYKPNLAEDGDISDYANLGQQHRVASVTKIKGGKAEFSEPPAVMSMETSSKPEHAGEPMSGNTMAIVPQPKRGKSKMQKLFDESPDARYSQRIQSRLLSETPSATESTEPVKPHVSILESHEHVVKPDEKGRTKLPDAAAEKIHSVLGTKREDINLDGVQDAHGLVTRLVDHKAQKSAGRPVTPEHVQAKFQAARDSEPVGRYIHDFERRTRFSMAKHHAVENILEASKSLPDISIANTDSVSPERHAKMNSDIKELHRLLGQYRSTLEVAREAPEEEAPAPQEDSEGLEEGRRSRRLSSIRLKFDGFDQPVLVGQDLKGRLNGIANKIIEVFDRVHGHVTDDDELHVYRIGHPTQRAASDKYVLHHPRSGRSAVIYHKDGGSGDMAIRFGQAHEPFGSHDITDGHYENVVSPGTTNRGVQSGQTFSSLRSVPLNEYKQHVRGTVRNASRTFTTSDAQTGNSSEFRILRPDAYRQTRAAFLHQFQPVINHLEEKVKGIDDGNPDADRVKDFLSDARNTLAHFSSQIRLGSYSGGRSHAERMAQVESEQRLESIFDKLHDSSLRRSLTNLGISLPNETEMSSLQHVYHVMKNGLGDVPGQDPRTGVTRNNQHTLGAFRKIARPFRELMGIGNLDRDISVGNHGDVSNDLEDRLGIARDLISAAHLHHTNALAKASASDNPKAASKVSFANSLGAVVKARAKEEGMDGDVVNHIGDFVGRFVAHHGSAEKALHSIDLASRSLGLHNSTRKYAQAREQSAILANSSDASPAQRANANAETNFAKTKMDRMRHGAHDALADTMFHLLPDSHRDGLTPRIADNLESYINGYHKVHHDALRDLYEREKGSPIATNLFGSNWGHEVADAATRRRGNGAVVYEHSDALASRLGQRFVDRLGIGKEEFSNVDRHATLRALKSFWSKAEASNDPASRRFASVMRSIAHDGPSTLQIGHLKNGEDRSAGKALGEYVLSRSFSTDPTGTLESRERIKSAELHSAMGDAADHVNNVLTQARLYGEQDPSYRKHLIHTLKNMAFSTIDRKFAHEADGILNSGMDEASKVEAIRGLINKVANKTSKDANGKTVVSGSRNIAATPLAHGVQQELEAAQGSTDGSWQKNFLNSIEGRVSAMRRRGDFLASDTANKTDYGKLWSMAGLLRNDGDIGALRAIERLSGGMGNARNDAGFLHHALTSLAKSGLAPKLHADSRLMTAYATDRRQHHLATTDSTSPVQINGVPAGKLDLSLENHPRTGKSDVLSDAEDASANHWINSPDHHMHVLSDPDATPELLESSARFLQQQGRLPNFASTVTGAKDAQAEKLSESLGQLKHTKNILNNLTASTGSDPKKNERVHKAALAGIFHTLYAAFGTRFHGEAPTDSLLRRVIDKPQSISSSDIKYILGYIKSAPVQNFRTGTMGTLDRLSNDKTLRAAIRMGFHRASDSVGNHNHELGGEISKTFNELQGNLFSSDARRSIAALSENIRNPSFQRHMQETWSMDDPDESYNHMSAAIDAISSIKGYLRPLHRGDAGGAVSDKLGKKYVTSAATHRLRSAIDSLKQVTLASRDNSGREFNLGEEVEKALLARRTDIGSTRTMTTSTLRRVADVMTETLNKYLPDPSSFKEYDASQEDKSDGERDYDHLNQAHMLAHALLVKNLYDHSQDVYHHATSNPVDSFGDNNMMAAEVARQTGNPLSGGQIENLGKTQRKLTKDMSVNKALEFYLNKVNNV